MIAVGLDPGLDGGMAALTELPRAWVWPTVELGRSGGGSKRAYDVGGMLELLRVASDLSKDSHFFLEAQHSMPGQGVASMFSLGYGFGLLVMGLASLGRPWTLVSARTWQAEMLAGMPRNPGKKASAQAHLVCSRLWPRMELRASPRAQKPHSGICDALLIAEWGRRSLGGGS